MKKIVLALSLIFSVVTYAQDCGFTPFNVALSDDSDSDTNVRQEPNGELILKLNKTDEFVMEVTAYKAGWFKIANISSVYYGYEISNLEAWIHQSTVGLWARKKINLLDAPNTGTSLGAIAVENGPVKIKDICGDWVKIKFEDLTGWVELQWLCGNPVTTCP